MTAIAETPAPSTTPWWRVPLYPATIPLAIILQAWAAAAIHPAAMYRPLLLAIAFSLLLTLALSLVCRNRDLGALAASGALLAIVAAAVPSAGLIVLLAVLLIIALGLVRRGRPWPLGARITQGMNIVGAVLLLASAINLVQTSALTEGVEDLRLDLEGRGPIGVAASGSPDIYLLLLDGYPGADARAMAPDHPPSVLRDELLARGFDMAEDTHSNYLQTTTTLASMFQMRHLQGLPELAPPWGPEPSDSRRLRRLINAAPALDALRDAGYTSTAVASGFAEVELRRVDRLVEPVSPTEFEHSLIRGTGLGLLLDAVAPDLLPETQRARIEDSFTAVVDAAEADVASPRFVLGHIPGPHPPWVFGADGEPIRDDIFAYYTDSARDRAIDRSEAMRRHLDQAEYVDRRVVETVDRILAASTTPPVIVVFSDHGSGTGFDQDAPLVSDLKERTSNVLAAYTPGHPGLFAEPTRSTPIAILPSLLDTYLGMDVAVPDPSVWAWQGELLDFVPVDVDD